MTSPALKNFKTLWADACKTMWIEIAALRHLESSIHTHYATLSMNAVLTDWIYAPECRKRIDDTNKDFILEQMPRLISAVATSRIVLLAAGFESYFEEFLNLYLCNRPKFFSNGSLTNEGKKSSGEILKCRGPVARIEALPVWTTAKIATIKPNLPILADVYSLRNTMAHDAGIVNSHTAERVKSISVSMGQLIQVNPSDVISILAPPLIDIAEKLDAKIHPHRM